MLGRGVIRSLPGGYRLASPRVLDFRILGPLAVTDGDRPVRLSALEQQFDAELELGRHANVLAGLESLVWNHPLRERLRGQLMLALYRAGRQAEALAVYRKTREALVAEFGIEPSPLLHELEHR